MAWVMIHTTLRPDLVPESERALSRIPFDRAHQGAEGACAGDLPDRRGARLDVWRHRDAVGERRGRRARRGDRGGAAGRADAQGDARHRDRRGADLLDDRHDPARRLDPRQRGGLPRHPARGRGFRRQHGALAVHADRRADRVLPDPRLLPRRLLDDRDDLADRAADREAGRASTRSGSASSWCWWSRWRRSRRRSGSTCS